MVVTRLVGTRADLLDAGRILEEAALDKYTFLRDAYLQRRESLVNDGRRRRERYEDEAPPEKVNEAPRSSVDRAGPRVYLPRIPRNYEAVMAAGTPHAKTD
jgi:phospholipid-binding lipoprotein MlaA